MNGQEKTVKNIEYIMNLVQTYTSSKQERWEFELDFNSELTARYKKMVKENREYAELIYDYISEDGVDAGRVLSDAEFKSLIRKQYRDVLDIVEEGFL